jgi:lysophospholipase L1-like esterase
MVMGAGSEGTISMNIRSMVELATVHNIKVVLASLPSVCSCYSDIPTQTRPVGKIAGINATLHDIAKEYNAAYLDYFKPLIDPVSRELKKEFTDNGTEPNDAAYAVLAPPTDQAIATALATK